MKPATDHPPLSGPLKFGSVELRPGERQLLIDGAPAKLGARAFDVLLALAGRRERVVSKEELLDLVWPDLVVEENNLQVHISALRKGARATDDRDDSGARLSFHAVAPVRR